MSPLALLQEGETAEIVDLDENGAFGRYHNRHAARHGNCSHDGCCDRREIQRGRGPVPEQHRVHLQDMGLRPGKKVEMITNSGAGPLVLRVDECRIAMGRGAAMKIYVRRNGQ